MVNRYNIDSPLKRYLRIRRTKVSVYPKKPDFSQNPVFLTGAAMEKLTVLHQFKSESVFRSYLTDVTPVFKNPADWRGSRHSGKSRNPAISACSVY